VQRRHGARVVGSVVGIGGFAFCLTLLARAMRSVQAIGGFCASGGPYRIAHHCPKGVAGIFPLAVVGGLAGLGLFALCVGDRGRPVALLAWPALFLTLGWNFLDYGLNPPSSGVNAGFLVSAGIFILMGGIPLVLLAPGLLRGVTGRTEAPTASPVLAPTGVRFTVPPAPPRATTAPSPRLDLASELERLASLHRRGELSDAEYQAAKRQALQTPAGSP
jgi:hypothetical protein